MVCMHSRWSKHAYTLKRVFLRTASKIMGRMPISGWSELENRGIQLQNSFESTDLIGRAGFSRFEWFIARKLLPTPGSPPIKLIAMTTRAARTKLIGWGRCLSDPVIDVFVCLISDLTTSFLRELADDRELGKFKRMCSILRHSIKLSLLMTEH